MTCQQVWNCDQSHTSNYTLRALKISKRIYYKTPSKRTTIELQYCAPLIVRFRCCAATPHDCGQEVHCDHCCHWHSSFTLHWQAGGWAVIVFLRFLKRLITHGAITTVVVLLSSLADRYNRPDRTPPRAIDLCCHCTTQRVKGNGAYESVHCAKRYFRQTHINKYVFVLQLQSPQRAHWLHVLATLSKRSVSLLRRYTSNL